MNPPKSVDEETAIVAVVLSAIIILAALVVHMVITPSPVETFSTLYLLDAERKAESYPEQLVLGVNNTFLSWIGVENFMGRLEYFLVLVKLGNSTSRVDPCPLEDFKRFEKILLHNERWEFPCLTTVNQTGTYRMIIELWLFDEKQNDFSYSKRWLSIWFDVI